MPLLTRLLAVALLGVAACFAAPSCEVKPPTRQKLEELDKVRDTMPGKDSTAFARKRLQQWIDREPDNIDLHRRFIELFTQDDRLFEELPAIQEKYRLRAEKRQDAVSVYLYGFSLQRFNTPESIRQMEKAKSLDPSLYYPYVSLGSMLSRTPKFRDKARAAANIGNYFEMCPATFEINSLFILLNAGTPEAKAAVAARLRPWLAAQTDPEKLRNYYRLWRLEFQVRPVTEHAQLRKQVAADLARLEKLNLKPSKAEWYNTLITGYQLTGAPKATISAVEDRLLKAFPSDGLAYNILSQRETEARKPPAAKAPGEEWDAFLTAEFENTEKSAKRFPSLRFLKQSALMQPRQVPGLSNQKVQSLIDDALGVQGGESDVSADVLLAAVELLLERRIASDRVPGLLRAAAATHARVTRLERAMDEMPDESRKRMEEWYKRQELNQAEVTLRAARVLQQPELAAGLEALVKAPVPDALKTEWLANLARLAEVERHTADALAYYQAALHSRKKEPEMQAGRVTDPLLTDARRVWKSAGGTDDAWGLWRKPPVAVQTSDEGRWERPKKPLPAFELTDLSGKLWRLKSLEGKSVLINVWATWCGPCQSELPHLQKLYEQTKGRSDIAILTLNIDSEIGLVELFMKEKKYTFPAIPAEKFVTELLEEVTVPQNWIVDQKGKWQWTQFGFNESEPDWEKTMLAKLTTP